MMHLYIHHDAIQVLSFDSTAEARGIGKLLMEMGDGCKHLAVSHPAYPDRTPEQLEAAIKEAIKRIPK